MGDRKLSDLAIAFFIFIGIFGIFLTVIIAFDNASNNPDAIGNRMLSASNLQDQYVLGNETAIDNSQSELQSVTFNNNTFQAPVGQFIDTRGVSQGNIIANNYPSTITHFLSGIKNLFPFRGSGYVWFIIGSIILIIGIVVLLRSFQGTFKW